MLGRRAGGIEPAHANHLPAYLGRGSAVFSKQSPKSQNRKTGKSE